MFPKVKGSKRYICFPNAYLYLMNLFFVASKGKGVLFKIANERERHMLVNIYTRSRNIYRFSRIV